MTLDVPLTRTPSICILGCTEKSESNKISGKSQDTGLSTAVFCTLCCDTCCAVFAGAFFQSHHTQLILTVISWQLQQRNGGQSWSGDRCIRLSHNIQDVKSQNVKTANTSQALAPIKRQEICIAGKCRTEMTWQGPSTNLSFPHKLYDFIMELSYK